MGNISASDKKDIVTFSGKSINFFMYRMNYDDDKEVEEGVGLSDDALLEEEISEDEDEDEFGDSDEEEKDWE